MSIKPLLNSNSIDNKTLNLFGNTLSVNNVDTTTINGTPAGSGVQNPLTQNLKLGGFAIVEELGLAPSLNIDQLDNTKDIKLKIAGISKVDVKNNEIQLNENLNMNSNEIKNVSVIDNSSGNLQIIGQSTTSAVELDPNPTDGVNITTASKNINVISNNDLLLKSNSSFLDIDSNLIRFISTGTPQGQIDAVGGYEFFNALSMTNNNINNVNALQANQVNTDTIENSGSGFLSFTNLGSYIPSFTPSGLDMNDGELLSVNNIRTNIQPILTINKNGSNATEIYGNSTIRRLQVSNAVYLLSGTNLECGTNDINDCGNLNVSSINNLSPIGGLSTGLSNSLLLSTSTAEQSILPTSFLGTRTIPPNIFKQGDSYFTSCSGSFSSNNGDTLTIRLKSGASTLNTFSIPLNASAGVFFELSVNFNIRQIGVAGVAQLVSSFQFTYNQSAGGNFQGIRNISINSTTFDTTIINDLDITGQFSSASASNSIQTIHSVLYKTF